MACLPRHFIGIAERGEVQQATLASALSCGNGFFTGCAAEDHLRALVGEVSDIGTGLVGLRTGVLAE